MQRKAEMQKLIALCEQWSVERGLDNSSSPIEQNFKLIEEFGELARHIQKKNVLEIMDGLGDTLVVCAVMASEVRPLLVSEESKNLNLFSTNEANFLTPVYHIDDLPKLFWSSTQALHRYSTYVIDTHAQQQCGHYLFQFAGKLGSQLDALAKCLSLDIVKCLKMAYSTIHFRSGEIVDGVFVKREPQAIVKVSTKKLDLDVDNLIQEIVEYAKQEQIDFFKVEFELVDDKQLTPINGLWIKEV